MKAGVRVCRTWVVSVLRGELIYVHVGIKERAERPNVRHFLSRDVRNKPVLDWVDKATTSLIQQLQKYSSGLMHLVECFYWASSLVHLKNTGDSVF
jgi:hypothetical protein